MVSQRRKPAFNRPVGARVDHPRRTALKNPAKSPARCVAKSPHGGKNRHHADSAALTSASSPLPDWGMGRLQTDPRAA
jgi:hypothetical protein